MMQYTVYGVMFYLNSSLNRIRQWTATSSLYYTILAHSCGNDNSCHSVYSFFFENNLANGFLMAPTTLPRKPNKYPNPKLHPLTLTV